MTETGYSEAAQVLTGRYSWSNERIGALGADIHAALHDSFCGDDPDSCLKPGFWITTAIRVVKRGTLDGAPLHNAGEDKLLSGYHAPAAEEPHDA